MKVGRSALDEDAIRLIEEMNPDIEFDWTRILKGPVVPTPDSAAPARPQRGSEKRSNWSAQRSATPARDPRGSRRDVRPGSPTWGTREEPAQAVSGEMAADDQEGAAGVSAEASAVPTKETPIELPSAAHARLGPEGVLRLRARYSEILARISERVADPDRRDELKARAERLNPDTWVTDEEVNAGLEQYERDFAALRNVVGRKRFRGRGSRAAREAATTGGEQLVSAAGQADPRDRPPEADQEPDHE